MDLKALMDATAPVEFDFLGEHNTAVVYTAGLKRVAPDHLVGMEDEAVSALYGVGLASLPAIVKSWDVKWGDDILPLDRINEKDENGKRVYQVPFSFFNALLDACQGVFVDDPTKASVSPAGLQLAANSEGAMVS